MPALECVVMDDSVEPGLRVPRVPILGYEESSEQPDLTRSLVLSFPPCQLQDPEHIKAEHKVEKSGDESWAPQDEPQSVVLGMYQRLASDHPSGGLQFSNA